MSRDQTITKPSEPEYEDVKIVHKPNRGVKMNANPAYHCGAKVIANPAYKATN